LIYALSTLTSAWLTALLFVFAFCMLSFLFINL
jgi:hypothetical protein